MWRSHDLKPTYDVVIIGAGVHGLAIAYYLGKRGITNVAVLDKGYLGGGASGRNTAIIRSNYRTPEGVAFYDESVKLYEGLSAELGYNVLFSQQGHLTLAHTDSAINGLRVRAEINQLSGIDVANGAVAAVRTTRGDIKTGAVLNATAGFCSTVARMVGLDLPVTTHPLQAFVTEPLEAFLDKVLVSANLHVYVSQTDRGEGVIGSGF